MTGVASLAVMMVTAGGVRAETVIVQGADGAAGVMGGDPISGGDGESVAAVAGSVHPITFPQNEGTATGGNGGEGGFGEFGAGGGGNGGAATAKAGTAITSGSAGADAGAGA